MAADNKTEQPTPRRRLKAREKGQIARSRDLIGGLATVTAVVVLAASTESFSAEWRGLLRHGLESAAGGDLAADSSFWGWSQLRVFRGTAVALTLAWIAAAFAEITQGEVVFAADSLEPKLSRLSPASRMKQLFSLPAMGRLLKSLLPAAAVLYLAGIVVAREWPALLTASHLSAFGIARFSLQGIFEIAWKSSLVLLLWAGVDYMLERHKLESDLRMSRQELIDEFKETEGHPTIKSRIRRLQRQVRRRRMLEDTKRAALVITNPTEFAVALEYRPAMAAPVVVAKGRNLLARQIKEVARWHSIPLVENPPLAHALYRAVEIGQSIPPKLYAVVAGILAAIYRAHERARQAAGGAR
ncbi:MAG TPA: EscU/YscU/HrcU family type III secretion system export apparatus switch protein [Terriglobales bacterium]